LITHTGFTRRSLSCTAPMDHEGVEPHIGENTEHKATTPPIRPASRTRRRILMTLQTSYALTTEGLARRPQTKRAHTQHTAEIGRLRDNSDTYLHIPRCEARAASTAAFNAGEASAVADAPPLERMVIARS
jgi:hypothetical protein